MESPEKTASELVMMLSTAQSIGTRTRFADLVIGGLLLVFVVGGFVM